MNNSKKCWMLPVAFVCTPVCMLLGVIAQSLKPVSFPLSTAAPNIVTQQLPTFWPDNVGSCWPIMLHPLALTFFNHQKVTRKQGPLLPANSTRLKLRTSHGFNVNVAFQNFRLFARKPFCTGFVKHHKTSALSITTIRIPGIQVSRSSSPLVACVQTSPLSQKETYFCLREGGRLYTGQPRGCEWG